MHRRFGTMPTNMFFVWIIPIILLALIGIALYMVWKNKKGDHKDQSSSALDILDMRYAKGEIDEEEYKNMKKNLSSFDR